MKKREDDRLSNWLRGLFPSGLGWPRQVREVQVGISQFNRPLSKWCSVQKHNLYPAPSSLSCQLLPQCHCLSIYLGIETQLYIGSH